MNRKVAALQIGDGTLEALKWLGIGLMTADHVNKYLFAGRYEALFAAGRLALPLFCFVLVYNLSRPGFTASGGYQRVMKRLAVAGGVASIPFMLLGGLLFSVYPLNILFTLLIATAIFYCREKPGFGYTATALALFFLGGFFIEYWWFALLLCLAYQLFIRQPGALSLVLVVGALAALYAVNKNFWAIGALPLIFLADRLALNFKRSGSFFYIYYPAHLTVILIAQVVTAMLFQNGKPM